MNAQVIAYLMDEQKKELSSELQQKMCHHFLEHRMYDINDSLTSILALCDMEQMKSLHKVKTYIQKVNSLLDDVKAYDSSPFFNVSHVLKNVVNIIQNHFKKSDIVYESVALKVLGTSDRSRLEHLLIFILIELITDIPKNQKDATIKISLSQKNTLAVIKIQKSHYSFSATGLKEIESLKSKFSGDVSISPVSKGIDILIHVPLSSRSSSESYTQSADAYQTKSSFSS